MCNLEKVLLVPLNQVQVVGFYIRKNVAGKPVLSLHFQLMTRFIRTSVDLTHLLYSLGHPDVYYVAQTFQELQLFLPQLPNTLYRPRALFTPSFPLPSKVLFPRLTSNSEFHSSLLSYSLGL